MLSRTVVPETIVLVTKNGTPSTKTVYALAGAVVAINASSYVIVIHVPAEFTAAEVKTGARKSGATVELFVVGNSANGNVSFPEASWTAAFEGEASGVGAS